MNTPLRALALPSLLLTAAVADAAEQVVVHRSMDVVEFVALQRLSDAALRARFRLPDSCNPSMSAVRGTAARVQVLIVCEPEGGLGQPSWTERPRSPRDLP